MKHELCSSSTTKPASNLLTSSGTLHEPLRKIIYAFKRLSIICVSKTSVLKEK